MRPGLASGGDALVLGVDIGGTKIAAGLVDATGEVVSCSVRPTPVADARAVLEAVCELRDDLDGRGFGAGAAIGVAAAGLVNASGTRVAFAPNIPSWRDEPFADRLAARTGLPVVIENDANAAGWAEARFGAGQGHRHQTCVTVGTGIGGAVIVDGALVRGHAGYGGEIGHMIVQPAGQSCSCGSRGCWEAYASGSAITQRARTMAAQCPGDTMLGDLVDGNLDALTGAHVLRAAQAGDAAALAAYREGGTWLGAGLAALATVLDTGLFVIAGGAAAAGDLLLAPARGELQRLVVAAATRQMPEVVVGDLGGEAGIVGAAALARNRLSPGTAVG